MSRVAKRPLRVRVAGTRLPNWFAHALRKLAQEGTIAPQGAGAAPVLAPPRAEGGLDALLARRFARSESSAWEEVEAGFPPAAEPPDLELSCSAAAPACAEAPLWVLRIGEPGRTRLEIVLEERAPDGSARTLARTATRSTRSPHLSLSQAGWKAAGLLERALRAHAAGERPQSRAPEASAEPLRGSRLARACGRVLCPGAWRLAWRARGAAGGLPESASWSPEQQLVAPRGRYYADPFLLEHAGREALFFEDVDERSGRGEIACVELDERGRAGAARSVLRLPHHLSYPFVFEHEGAAWMIPEMHTQRRIELWRASEFPWRWERAAVLLEGLRAVDATWLVHEGRYWLFACVAGEHAPLSEELCAWWSERPFGPWTAHPANPIVDDPCGARPAGRFFVEGGKLVRPAQDCLREYGARILFQEVLALDPQRYEERTLADYEARWLAGCDGTHTYDRSRRHEVIDARRPRWRLPFAGFGGR